MIYLFIATNVFLLTLDFMRTDTTPTSQRIKRPVCELFFQTELSGMHFVQEMKTVSLYLFIDTYKP